MKKHTTLGLFSKILSFTWRQFLKNLLKGAKKGGTEKPDYIEFDGKGLA